MGKSGYIYNFEIAGDVFGQSNDIEPGVGRSGQVVLDLLSGLEAPRPQDDPSHIAFDDYFSSPALLRTLR